VQDHTAVKGDNL